MNSLPRSEDGQTALLLEPFLALLPDAVLVIGTDGHIVHANELATDLFDYPVGELTGRPIETLVPERLRPRHRQHRASYIAAPRARPMGAGQELTGRRRDGTEFPVDISLAPLPGQGQDLVIAAVRDATDRQVAQQARSQLATIVESSLDAIISLTLQGHIASWNPGAERLFVYAPAEIVGAHVSLLVPDERSAELEELLEAALAGTSTSPRDTQWKRRDGSVLDVALSISPIRNPAGDTVGFSALLRDVTERKRHDCQVAATSAIRLKLLSGAPLDECLQMICQEACTLLPAENGAVVLIDDGGTARLAAVEGAGHRTGLGEGSVARRVLETAAPVHAFGLSANGSGPDAPGSVLGVPVTTGQGVNGALLASRSPDGPEFADGDSALLGDLADQAALGIELARVRRERELALRVGDRERIGRDLQDVVIQQLFAVGMELEGIARLNDDPAVAERIERSVDAIDETIRHIRATVFQLDDG